MKRRLCAFCPPLRKPGIGWIDFREWGVPERFPAHVSSPYLEPVFSRLLRESGPSRNCARDALVAQMARGGLKLRAGLPNIVARQEDRHVRYTPPRSEG